MYLDCSTSLIQHYSILLPPGVNVVFYAMVGAYSGLVDEHRIIKFDDVQLNIGDAYNIDSGRFKAPTDGIYSISYEALASDQCNDDYMCVSLFMDDEIVRCGCQFIITHRVMLFTGALAFSTSFRDI